MNNFEVFFYIGLLIFFIFLIAKSKSKSVNTTDINTYKNSYAETTNENSNQSSIYKKKEIKQFEIKGVFYNNTKNHSGDFIGLVKNTYNSHDKYSVGIFYNDSLLGYAPKGNFRLHNYINNSTYKKMLCWGFISFNGYDNSQYGTVYIPVNYTDQEVEEIHNNLTLITSQKLLFDKQNKTTEDYFTILENDFKIKNSIPISALNYNFNKKLIPELSKKLEQEKDFNSLLRLKKFDYLIEELSDIFKNTTLKRIEKAESISNSQKD